MSCHVMPCHVMSCHVMSCHVMSGSTHACLYKTGDRGGSDDVQQGQGRGGEFINPHLGNGWWGGGGDVFYKPEVAINWVHVGYH